MTGLFNFSEGCKPVAPRIKSLGRTEVKSARPDNVCKADIRPIAGQCNRDCFDPRAHPKIETGIMCLLSSVVAGPHDVRPIAEARRYIGRVALEPTPKRRRGNVRETALVKERLTSLGDIRKLGPVRSGGSRSHAYRAEMALAFQGYLALCPEHLVS